VPETHRGSPRALERLVRVRYPAAVVRPQTDLAASRSMRIWYVYRDGSAMPASSQLQSSSQ
jgi:hypothetical protein